MRSSTSFCNDCDLSCDFVSRRVLVLSIYWKNWVATELASLVWHAIFATRFPFGIEGNLVNKRSTLVDKIAFFLQGLALRLDTSRETLASRNGFGARSKAATNRCRIASPHEGSLSTEL